MLYKLIPVYTDFNSNSTMPFSRFEAFNSVETFEVFFQGWMVRQENYLNELLRAVECIRKQGGGKEDEVKCKELVARVVAHYHQYYKAKSKATREDVHLVLSPPWFSPLERSLFWVAGFRPGLVFQLVTNYVTDLSEAQRRRFDRLAAETREEEREVAEVVARVQDTLAGSLVMEAARVSLNGDCDHVDLVMERVRSTMEEVVESGDWLRVKTVMKSMEIMSAAQTVVFLAAFANFHHIIRIRGMKRQEDH